MHMACWHITAELDHETGERAGAGGTFQVVGLEDDEGNDLTALVDQGVHFHSIAELKQAIVRGFAARLEVTEED
jgi:trehalose/maltose hydrolase-like predicted phosphorylase